MNLQNEILVNCINKIKTATANQNENFQIDEELKTEVRRSHKFIDIKILTIYMFLTYLISFISVAAIILPLLIYYYTIKNHPSFRLAILWLHEGASYNQIEVVYYQIFRHFIKFRYIFFIGTILLCLSCFHYVYNFSFLNIGFYFFPSNIEQYLYNELGLNIFKQYEQLQIDLPFSKDWLYYIFAFSPFREFSANLNTFSILVLIFFRLIQIVRRPK